MRVREMSLLTCSLMMASCNQTPQVRPDPSSDIDCSVVTFYFKGLADHDRAEADQRAALGAVSNWYARRAEAIAKEQGAESVLQRAGPILDAVKAEPKAMGDELQACTDRAVREGIGSS